MKLPTDIFYNLIYRMASSFMPFQEILELSMRYYINTQAWLKEYEIYRKKATQKK